MNTLTDLQLELIAKEAAEKLMHDRPYIGSGIDTDELKASFLEAIKNAIEAQRRHLGPG